MSHGHDHAGHDHGGPTPESADEAKTLRTKLSQSQTPKKGAAGFFADAVDAGQ